MLTIGNSTLPFEIPNFGLVEIIGGRECDPKPICNGSAAEGNSCGVLPEASLVIDRPAVFAFADSYLCVCISNTFQNSSVFGWLCSQILKFTRGRPEPGLSGWLAIGNILH